MGIYYIIVNVDKNEALSPHDFNNGAKMAEWCHQENSVVLALHNLLAGRWKGDKVFVVSDDVAGVDNYNKTLTDIREKLGVRDVYGYAYEHCKRLQPEDVDTEDHGLRYIYNHARKIFIDLEHCPRYTDWIDPLPLLIAIGHDGPGGGNFDFRDDENMMQAMESWCDSVNFIEMRKELLPGLDYEEYQPGFTEEPPGRHYYIVNVDKRERLCAYDLQLLDWAACRGEVVLMLHTLLAGRWKGDRVYVVANDALKGWDFPENDALCDELKRSVEKGLFLYAEKHYRNIGPEVDPVEQDIRYIYNHALKVYIDLKHCPLPEDDWACIAPLPLLLAIGNVGDTAQDLAPEDDGFEYVGTWCPTVRSIEVSREPLPNIGYPEFRPNFLERKQME